ncbi:protein rogdi-like [Centruroides sculpturatus]|uniref:protein rogdi-like n=1 Tax=Centruroides sculpturatus TaxID=218467 RepID=UPI000C6DB543|nr:protein rogdi-like [Centruroides sculpturatus]
MEDLETDEVETLHQEFEWLLQNEVNAILQKLHNIILECSRRFCLSITKDDTLVKSEKFEMTNGSNSSVGDVKATLTLYGDNITHADIKLKIYKHSNPSHRTIVQNDCQWKLQQIQDAGNHLMAALHLFSSYPCIAENGKFNFKSAEEVIQMINSLMGCLQRGRTSLIVPKKRTMDDLQNSRNMKSLQPPLPLDLAVSFYIQSHKLVIAVYHIQKDSQGQTKFDVLQAESFVPWLNEALILFSVGLQLCQQLKDKVSVFSQYKEMNNI